MVRLLINPTELTGKGATDSITLTGDQNHKVRSVLRMSAGDQLELLDGRGNIYQTEIEEIGKDKSTLKVTSSTKVESPKTSVTLIQAVAKGKRFDLVLQKATEIGVTRIIPVVTKRTISNLAGKEEKKVERWREIVRHAIEQCGQPWLPKVGEPISLSNLKDSLPAGDLRLLLNEEERGTSLRDSWPSMAPNDVQILIGPEGGFEPDEVEFAKKLGFQSITLGPLILRTDTAPLVALTLVRFLAGELG